MLLAKATQLGDRKLGRRLDRLGENVGDLRP
jgi:hypothetical protein